MFKNATAAHPLRDLLIVALALAAVIIVSTLLATSGGTYTDAAPALAAVL
jgi:hypothetical protein